MALRFPRTIIWQLARSTISGAPIILCLSGILADSAQRKPPYDITKNYLLVATQGVDSLNQAFTLGDTYLFGPNLVNAVRLAANRFRSYTCFPTVSDLGGPRSQNNRVSASLLHSSGQRRAFHIERCRRSCHEQDGHVCAQRRSKSGSRKPSVGVRWIRSALAGEYPYTVPVWWSIQIQWPATVLGMRIIMMGIRSRFNAIRLHFRSGTEWYIGTYYAADTWKVTPN